MKEMEDLKEEQNTADDAQNTESAEDTSNGTEDFFDAEMQVLTLMSENQDLSNRLLRLQADFENFKRRTRAERDELLQYANFELCKKLLPVLDNFERAAGSGEADAEKLMQGITMIFRQFKDILEKEGLKEISCVGEQFNPNLHDAVMQEESAEHEENTVLMELQKGYLFKDKLLRPAMVKVCKKS